ncbi:MFS transporter [Stackebrandtia albiflava]
MLARVAVASLVWNTSQSPLLAMAAFAISYAPYLGPAQLLAALADRLPYRSVMVTADFIRMVLIGIMAIPGMPLPLMLVLMFTSAMVEPAYQASRSALLPKLVSGEALTLALSIYLTLNQTAQLTGYFVGGILAAVNPRIALSINAVVFAVSGLLLLAFVRHRAAEGDATQRKGLLRETGEGFALVFGNRVLRTIALVVFTTLGFTIVPEGSAVPWADELGGGPIVLALLMTAAPAAAMVSSIVFTRFVRPSVRQRLIRPLVLLAPLSLVPALLEPAWPWAVLMAMVCNLTAASLAPLNAIFVRTVPDGYRARAFSVMQTGMSLVQGIGIIGAGALAQSSLGVSQSVGVWGLAGTAVVILLLWRWPSSREFDDAVAQGEKTEPATTPDRPTVASGDAGPAT